MRPNAIRHSRSLPVIGQIACNQETMLHGIEPSLSKRHVACNVKRSFMRCLWMRLCVYTRQSGCNGVASNRALTRSEHCWGLDTALYTNWPFYSRLQVARQVRWSRCLCWRSWQRWWRRALSTVDRTGRQLQANICYHSTPGVLLIIKITISIRKCY